MDHLRKKRRRRSVEVPVLFFGAGMQVEIARYDDVISPLVRTFADRMFFTAYWTERIRVEGYEPFEVIGG